MSGDPRAMLPGLILSMVIHPEKKLKIKMYILWFFFKNVKNGPKRGQNASEVADFPEFRKGFPEFSNFGDPQLSGIYFIIY